MKKQRDCVGLLFLMFILWYPVGLCIALTFELLDYLGFYTADLAASFFPLFFEAVHWVSWLFLIATIYTQFKDKKYLWGFISIVLFLGVLENYYNESENNPAIACAVILLISSIYYYFVHIRPKFKKKKGKRKKDRR